MEEWSDWVVEDSDPADMVQQMRGVLANRSRSHEEKMEALTLLTNMADDASIMVLRWYYEHADLGMELPAMLALLEAERLHEPPAFEAWHEALLEVIHRVGEELTQLYQPDRHTFQRELVRALQEEGWQVAENGRALLKYEGFLIDMVPIELVVHGQVLISIWDQADAEAALLEAGDFDALDVPDDGEVDVVLDPFDQFYAVLRTTNLPWGIHIDISDTGVFTDIVQNIEMDRGHPNVEYILALPSA